MTDVATLYVRNISPEVAARIKRRAEARGLTVGAYLERLEALHADMLAASNDEVTATDGWALLDIHGLGRVVD